MRLTRRDALMGGLSVAALGLMPVNVFAKTKRNWPLPLLVVITCDGMVHEQRVAAVADGFRKRGTPVTVAVPAATVAPAEYRDQLITHVRTLRVAHDAAPDLTEVAIDLGAIASQDPYFQLRQASAAQGDFTHFANLHHDPINEPLLMGLTATTTTPLRAGNDMLAVRGAGVRVVLHLGTEEADAASVQDATGGFWIRDNGLADIFGSPDHVAVTAAGRIQKPADLRKKIEQAGRSDNPVVLHLQLERMSELADADAMAYAAELAAIVSDLQDTGFARPHLPRALYASSRKEGSRYVILRADDYRGDLSLREPYEAFIGNLLHRGLPVSDAVIPVGAGVHLKDDAHAQEYLKRRIYTDGYEAALHGWTHAPDEFVGRNYSAYLREIRDGAGEMLNATGSTPRTFIPPYNVMDSAALDAMATAGLSMFSAHRGNYASIQGMDHRGLFHMSNIVGPEKAWTGDMPYFERDELWRQLDTENDTVFMLHPFTMQQPGRTELVMDVLADLQADPRNTITSFAGFEKAVLPPMPLLEQVREVRSTVTVRDTLAASGIMDAVQLHRDAEVAWTFMERGIERFGDMAPATAWLDEGAFSAYPFVTMWDVGSYVYGVVSAHLIGLIDDRGLEERVAGILKFLDASYYTFSGAKLTDAERGLTAEKPSRRGFNAADAGRLLLALKALDLYTATALPIEQQVKKWNFSPALAGGVMHDIFRGTATPVDSGYFAAYPRNGFTAWGYEVAPLYDDAGVGENMDATLRFIRDVASRGRIATEPFASEELEIGETPGTRTIVDFMHAAHIKRYADTGVLTCASEGPIDGAPFFSYQGYQIDPSGNGGTFVIDEAFASQRKDIDRRGDRMRLVSTKGCFLWAALRPGTYSDALLALARENGTLPDLGFASGIFEHNGRPTKQTDLNTNGIILEAIAYMLAGRVPLMQLSPLSVQLNVQDADGGAPA